jgi:hypothetical protein
MQMGRTSATYTAARTLLSRDCKANAPLLLAAYVLIYLIAGPVVAFNVLYEDGSYVPFSVVEAAAIANNIALRTGE